MAEGESPGWKAGGEEAALGVQGVAAAGGPRAAPKYDLGALCGQRRP